MPLYMVEFGSESRFNSICFFLLDFCLDGGGVVVVGWWLVVGGWWLVVGG